MKEVLRVLKAGGLKSSDLTDSAPNWQEANYQFVQFCQCSISDDDIWWPERTWIGIVSAEQLFSLLKDAGLLREVETLNLSDLE